MSNNKQTQTTLNAYYLGSNDKRLKRPYKNPFNKNKDKRKHKAYWNGYNE